MVIVFVGSRANYGRLKTVIAELEAREVEFGIILGTYDIPEFQEYILLRVDNLFYRDTTFNTVSSVSIVAQSVSNYLSNLTDLPSLGIVHGDRFENLGFAIACSYNNIKLLHTEGGEKSGNIDDKIRNAITALSDIHCVTTVESYSNLKMKGVLAHNIYVVGSPSIDYVKSLNLSPVIARRQIIAVLYNPCPEDNFDEFFEAILILAKGYSIIWVNPNVDPGYKKICKAAHSDDSIEFVKDLSPDQYYRFINECKCLVGNTSSGIKEGAYLGINYVLVGNRQLCRETASNVLQVKCEVEEIVETTQYIMEHRKAYIEYRGTFGNGDSSRKIVDIVKEIIRYDSTNTISKEQHTGKRKESTDN